MELGIDVGGTFTDVVAWDGTRVSVGKVSTSGDQSEGVIAAAAEVSDSPVDRLIHGTTVATNALLERTGARVALVTTKGFEDVLEIGRQNRRHLYAPWSRRPEPLVSRDRRFGVGSEPLGSLPAALASSGAEVFAVALLYGYLDPESEIRIAELIRERIGRDTHVSTSAAVSGEFREFERTSTTVLNAYLYPVMSGYLSNLEDRAAVLPGAPLITVMRSSGGLMTVGRCVDLPAAALLSGPAGGVVASAELGRDLAIERLISFDMGGTSTDVCRIENGRPEVMYERAIEGYACRLPSVAVHTVGAGGGSLAWIDDGGALRVGPRSAGAHPGPACYDRGGRTPTVTDANVVLGRIAGGARLGAEVAVRRDLAESAVARIGSELGLDVPSTAAGIIEIANAHMERAIRAVSVEQGADPRRAWLVAFGGAGALHASALGRALHMPGALVPPHAGVFSALGLLLSAPRDEMARSLAPDDDPLQHADEVAQVVSERFASDVGRPPDEIIRSVDMRYRGQSHEMNIVFGGADEWTVIVERFHRAHHQRNGFSDRARPVEVTTVRASVRGTPVMRWDDVPPVSARGEPDRGRRQVMFAGSWHESAVWWRPALQAGARLSGPAVVEEPEATILLEPGDMAIVGERGELEVTW